MLTFNDETSDVPIDQALDEAQQLLNLASDRIRNAAMILLMQHPGTELSEITTRAIHEANTLKYLSHLCKQMRERAKP